MMSVQAPIPTRTQVNAYNASWNASRFFQDASLPFILVLARDDTILLTQGEYFYMLPFDPGLYVGNYYSWHIQFVNSTDGTSNQQPLVMISPISQDPNMPGPLGASDTRSFLSMNCTLAHSLYHVSLYKWANGSKGWYLDITNRNMEMSTLGTQDYVVGTLMHPDMPGWYLRVCDDCDWGPPGNLGMAVAPTSVAVIRPDNATDPRIVWKFKVWPRRMN